MSKLLNPGASKCDCRRDLSAAKVAMNKYFCFVGPKRHSVLVYYNFSPCPTFLTFIFGHLRPVRSNWTHRTHLRFSVFLIPSLREG